jgi:hypothetical protein
MKKILIIVPTRNRNVNCHEFAQEFFKNSQISDIMFGLDDDNQQHYDRIAGVLYEVGPRLRLNGTLNFLARKYASQYEYIGFMGDDNRIRTPWWDMIMYEKMKNIPQCVAYGDDLIQRENLPTAVIMDSSIIQTLGFMSPPALTHLYLDNFWKDLGQELGTLTYFPDVIIEHMHFSKNKSKKDELYIETNSRETKIKDRTAYKEYIKTQFKQDLAKLK